MRRKTLWNPSTRAELLQRIDRLTPDSRPQWGRMTAGEMVAHILAGMSMGLGTLPTYARRTPFRHFPLRHIFLHWIPFPKGRIHAPREIVTSGQPFDWDANLAALRQSMADFAARDPRGSWGPHPVFGAMTGAEWGVMGWKHMDHHLRQFGV